ncbi:uncharacterized protein DFL_000605 [Arthrobotrys flagrans]|uniref:Uncharacterized protein n=1 Tax=Arthrobotrys flagrans TaxID=97331 RepID=A0A437AE88_ARTFL|nr:hypothetical protein DFL_000605 [Arthrobotrys flagrans]
MKKWKPLTIHLLVYLLNFQALRASFDADVVRGPCEGGIGLNTGCEFISLENGLVPLQKRNGDDTDIPDELDRYAISLAEFDESCTRGVARLQQYRERQESGGRDNPNPQAEVQLYYTIVPQAGVLACPDSVRRFYELLAIEGPPEAAEPSYQEFGYSPNNAMTMGSGAGASAVVRVSIPEGHMIVDWKGPNAGWTRRTEEYDIFETDYHKFSFLSWGVMRSKTMAADGSKDLNDPNYQLFFITIVNLRNSGTIKVLAEVLRRRNFDFDDPFEIRAPDSTSDPFNFVLWTALLGTPEIGAVQEMLNDWPYQFSGSIIHAIRFHLQQVGSTTELEATISVSIGPPQPYSENAGATEISFSVGVSIKDSSTDLVAYPGEEIFRGSSSRVFRLNHIEVPPDDGGALPGKMRARVVGDASFKRLIFEWLKDETFEAGRIEAFISGPEQHLVIDSELPDISSKSIRDIVYQIWDRGVGSNSRLSYITFMRLTSKTVGIVREIFRVKKVNPEDGAALTIWPSRKLWMENVGVLLPQGEKWLDEKVDANVFKELLPKSLEYSAVRDILARKKMWWQLGRPIIEAIEIGHRERRTDSGRERVFAILIRLEHPVGLDRDGVLSNQVSRKIASPTDFHGKAGVFKPRKLAADIVITMEEGYVSNDVEITIESRQRMETTYLKGMQKSMRVFDAVLGGRIRPQYTPRRIGNLVKKYRIDFKYAFNRIKLRQVIVKAWNPPASRSLVHSYIQTAKLPLEFVTVAGDDRSFYNRMPARVEDVEGDKYPYEVLQSIAACHLVISSLPEVNEAGEISMLPHVLYLGWAVATNRGSGSTSDDSGTRSGPATPQAPLNYISILKVSSQSKSILQEAFNFYGISTSGDMNIRLSTKKFLGSMGSLVTPFEKAERYLGVLGIVLGTAEVFAIQEMTRIYSGQSSLDYRVVKEVFIDWKTDNLSILVIFGNFDETFSRTRLWEDLYASRSNSGRKIKGGKGQTLKP